jgi:hypothetical protein
MIQRTHDFNEIAKRITESRVTAILGPRQSGKTTMARQFPTRHVFDLENPRDLARLEQPQLTLEALSGLIVIDEIQRRPDLFPLLRYLVDHRPDQRYLVLGSASPELLRQGSESLAGRISYYTLPGIAHFDLPPEGLRTLWLRGGLPPALTAPSGETSARWRNDYITSFLERDLPNLGLRIPAQTLRRFWRMAGHYHANIVNLSELGRSFGIADTTVRHYLEILQGTFMIRLLAPWHANPGKRLVKRPKLYFRDSGIFHTLTTLDSEDALVSSPLLGASWEGFALECAWRSIGLGEHETYFWATHSGAEVDLFWQHGGKNWACEFKYQDAPLATRSMHSALADLALERLWVVYPGTTRYPLSERIEVVPLGELGSGWQYP